ncbi:MAG TPA: MATE family efflux transporter [Lachnospiraceae bacterium]|nr:MATE family efflux transporter [Lachnospiraceae bacterium]
MKATNDLTVGKPLHVIILFAFPIFVGNIFQQLYNIVDTVVVGHVMGDKALAAVGAASVIYMLFISLANGMTNGFSIVIARYFGAKKYDIMRQAIAITIVLSAILSILLTVSSMVGIRPLLVFLNTPNDIIEQSDTYIRTILAAIAITMTYNMLAGILRGIGNSFMPLVFLIIACFINVILDLIFVKQMGLGIRGAALATVIAQSVAVILCIIYMIKKCPLLKLEKSNFKFNRKITIELFTTGLSMGLMFAIVSIGTIALQSAINGFGTLTITAHTSARRIGDIFMLPLTTLSVSAATFSSQNYGAKKMNRIKEGIKISFLLAFAWCTLANITIFFGAVPIIQLITGTKEAVVLETASRYMRINVPFYYILSILLILRSTLQGVGRRIIPLAASSVELILKFVVVGVLAPMMGYLGVCISEPMIWIVCSIMVLIDFYVTMNKSYKI